MSDVPDIEAPVHVDNARPGANEGGIKTTSSTKDLDAILQSMLEDEDMPIQMPDESSNAHSDMSSLLPFGNVVLSDCEQSISTGPLDERDMKDLDDEDQGQCPNEVYIQPTTSSTSYGSYFNRRRAVDESVSSNESNSLSSLMDSMGWTRRRNVHHSRGLKKREKKGFLYSYLSSHSDSAHHERESSRRGSEEKRMTRTRASVLVLSLCAILVLLTLWAIVQEEKEKKSSVDSVTPSELKGAYRYHSGMVSTLSANGGVPMNDGRPKHATDYYDTFPKDSQGRIVNPTVVALDDELSFLSNPFDSINNEEIPLFWIVPRSGGRSIRTALLTCYGLTIAGEVGAGVDSTGNELKVIDNGNFKYVNVETFTLSGLARAKQLNLVGSKIADVITTPLFRESLSLFDNDHHSRAFTLLRHPLERAVSMFEKLKKDNPEQAKDMTLEYYAKSEYIENNYLVRYLSGRINGNVTEEHLAIAKAVLQKFVLGFSDDMGKAMLRFETYFGFKGGSKCRDKLTKTRRRKHKVKPGTAAWELLQHQNVLDLALYRYAHELYKRQGNQLF